MWVWGHVAKVEAHSSRRQARTTSAAAIRNCGVLAGRSGSSKRWPSTAGGPLGIVSGSPPWSRPPSPPQRRVLRLAFAFPRRLSDAAALWRGKEHGACVSVLLKLPLSGHRVQVSRGENLPRLRKYLDAIPEIQRVDVIPMAQVPSHAQKLLHDRSVLVGLEAVGAASVGEPLCDDVVHAVGQGKKVSNILAWTCLDPKEHAEWTRVRGWG
eukprot:2051636-Rhodomonas_salina.3